MALLSKRSAVSRLPVWLLAAAAGLTLSLQSTHAHADEPVRPEHHDVETYPPSSARLPLLLTGAATTAVFFGGALGASYLWPDAPGARHLRIPVAGPWMALGKTGCATNDPGCSTLLVVLRAILTTLDGVVQAGGIAVMGEALFLPTTIDAPSATRSLRRHESAGAFEIHPVPIVSGRDGLGLGLVGRF